MDRNLGASRAATSATDFMAYGCFYQWGRGNDGHASVTWTSASAGTFVNGTTVNRSSSDTPVDALFITGSTTDWRNPKNDNLWQTSGTSNNNPCPIGFHVPTNADFIAEFAPIASLGYNITNASNAFANGPSGGFKLPLAGARNDTNGTLIEPTVSGRFWTSSINGTNANAEFLSASSISIGYSSNRAAGYSVRCIKD